MDTFSKHNLFGNIEIGSLKTFRHICTNNFGINIESGKLKNTNGNKKSKQNVFCSDLSFVQKNSHEHFEIKTVDFPFVCVCVNGRIPHFVRWFRRQLASTPVAGISNDGASDNDNGN